MVIRLSIVSGKSEGRVIQLPARQVVSLGRTVRADISLEDDPLISSKHCEIEHNGSAGIVRDLGSTNGTYLNGQAIREAQLQHNDRLRIGSTELVIQLDTKPAVNQAVRPAAASPVAANQETLGPADSCPPNPPRGPIESYGDSSVESGFFAPLQAAMQKSGPAEAPPQQTPPRANKAESSVVNPIIMSMEDSSHIVGHFDLPASKPKEKGDTAVAPEDPTPPNQPMRTAADPSAAPVKSFQGLADDHNGPQVSTYTPPAPPTSDRVVAAEHRMIRALPPELKDFREQPCASGLSLFQTLPVDLSQTLYTPSSLVDILAQHFAVMVVLHFQRMQQETPEALGAAHPLFDWLPEHSARQYGPILVDYDQLCSTGNAQAIDQLWGHDGCLVFLGAEREQLFEHVRGLIHRAVPGLSQEGGVFHFCWPSVLGQLLQKQSPATAQVIFANAVAGILTEISLQPTGWQIFAPPSFGDQLRALGLQAVPTAI